MTTFGKIKSIVAVLIVFLLILATNIIDKDNFARIEASVESIYDDQLMTKDAIRDLTKCIYEKEIAYLRKDTVYFKMKKDLANQQIKMHLRDCEEGEVNRKEGIVLKELRKHSDDIIAMENTDVAFLDQDAYYNRLRVIQEEIDKLGQIQMDEGRRQKMVSRDAMESTKLFSRIEVYLLIAIAIGIQFIILYPTKKS